MQALASIQPLLSPRCAAPAHTQSCTTPLLRAGRQCCNVAVACLQSFRAMPQLGRPAVHLPTAMRQDERASSDGHVGAAAGGQKALEAGGHGESRAADHMTHAAFH
jgi:hypothetical protein